MTIQQTTTNYAEASNFLKACETHFLTGDRISFDIQKHPKKVIFTLTPNQPYLKEVDQVRRIQKISRTYETLQDIEAKRVKLEYDLVGEFASRYSVDFISALGQLVRWGAISLDQFDQLADRNLFTPEK